MSGREHRGTIFVEDAVLLSHLHADHCLDLAGMYVARKYHPDGPPPALAVHGPRGTGRRIADAYRTSPGEPVDGLDRVYRFVDHSPDPVRIGPFTITVTRLVSGSTVGISISPIFLLAT